ncbi:MAG: bifunctional enoyl-CoA hydratase/phosphate acetyltransferase [Pseudomonadota bacterium]|nr:bifunctional enoyl-CoA hydratase/phosphate acetyltransferase [Pseudomonadota bacterium]
MTSDRVDASLTSAFSDPAQAQAAAPAAQLIENVTFDELQIGQVARMVRTLSQDDIRAFAAISGDVNPAHLDTAYADASMFHGVIAHGMLGGAFISAVLGTQLPGPGTIYLEQSLRFSRPVRVGDTLTVTVTVLSKDEAKKRVELDCVVSNQNDEKVLSGVARVLAPTQKVRRPRMDAPHIQLFDPEARLKALLAQAQDLAAVRCGVVHPCHPGVLAGALAAARAGLIEPVLIGPPERIRETAEAAGVDLHGMEIIAAPHSAASAATAAVLAADGRVQALMAGSLRKDELLAAVQAATALHTRRRLSHVFRFDVPTYAKPLLLTDAVLHVAPTLAEKADIVRNAIDLARVMGVETPRVAVLSSVEEIDAAVPSTVDAAALCKMVDSGQIGGGLIDGPLAFDSAVSRDSALAKHPHSAVAGQADILLAPDMEAASMLGRQLQYLAGATASGLVMGARVPITLCTHRHDVANAYVASAVLAKRLAHHYRLVRP